MDLSETCARHVRVFTCDHLKPHSSPTDNVLNTTVAQVEGDDWTQNMRRSFRSEKPAGFARPRGLAAEPYQVMFGLMPEDLQELHDEIKGYQVRAAVARLLH